MKTILLEKFIKIIKNNKFLFKFNFSQLSILFPARFKTLFSSFHVQNEQKPFEQRLQRIENKIVLIELD